MRTKRIWYLEQENATEPPSPSPKGIDSTESIGLELTSSTKTSHMMMNSPLAYACKLTLPHYVNTPTKINHHVWNLWWETSCICSPHPVLFQECYKRDLCTKCMHSTAWIAKRDHDPSTTTCKYPACQSPRTGPGSQLKNVQNHRPDWSVVGQIFLRK